MPLFNSDAEALITFGETGITGSNSNRAAMLVAGVTPTNIGSFVKVSEFGDMCVTGSVGISQSVPLTIGAFSTSVTGAVRIVQTNITQSVTGSVFAFNNATQRLWTTGSVALNGTLTPIITKIQGLDGQIAAVDGAGRLAVSSLVFPSGSTPIYRSLQQKVNTTSTSDLVYVIPNGKIFHFLSFGAGGQGSNRSSVVELFFDPNGNGTDMKLVRAIYVSDNSFDFPINPDVFQYSGNGTRAIRLRLRRLDSSTREIFGIWFGYLE